MTATYWEIGRRIVEFEQGGAKRAGYGEALLKRLAVDLTGRFGRGCSKPKLERMRVFYEMFPPARIASTRSRQLPPAIEIASTVSNELAAAKIPQTRSAKSTSPAYLTALPDEKLLSNELEKTRQKLESRRS